MAKQKQRTNEEQMQIRQSAPKPTPREEYARMHARDPVDGQGMYENGARDGMRALSQPIGKEFVQKAVQTLQKYKEGKANLERRIVENEQWYKMRHWDWMNGKGRSKPPISTEAYESSYGTLVQPTSGWLFNAIINKLADAMDAFPSPNILPREEGDREEAQMLTSIIPVVLSQNDFEQTYHDVWEYKLKTGTGVYGVFWNPQRNNIGDVEIKRMDLINLFWESGITDIQDSKYLFSVELRDNESLVSQYPQLQGKLTTSTINVAKYIYDDSVDTSDKSVVVNMYYKKLNSQGKQILHLCIFVNDQVLFATENDPNYADRGFYDHGKYPFVFDGMFSIAGSPASFGFIDVGKSAQEYIDRGNQAIMQNMLANTRPRHFIRSDGSVNEDEYADITKDFVHVDGNLGQDSIMPIQGKPLPEIYVSVINQKIDELKETTSNRDVQTGGSTGGVTAASGLAAMMEQASKTSRLFNKAAYRAFREVCLLTIELIRQFYDMPRYFRILGENGAQKFVTYSNAGIRPQPQGMEFGVDMGMRLPLFDVEVTAQKQSPYSKMAQNELALQFYNAGFFNPQMADQALLCLDMMDFDRKDFVINKIQQNGTMFQQMMALAQMVDQAHGSNEITMGLVNQYGGMMGGMGGADPEVAELDGEGKESSVTADAREKVAEQTAPR